MGDVLVAHGLRKRFKGTQAVDGVDIAVGPGERVGLLGANGAGKTTTLLMLLGAITPDEGTIEIAGHRLPKHRSEAMEHVGFAAGYLPMPDRMRVREALAYFGGLAGMRRPAAEAAIAEQLTAFRITHLAEQLCDELSSGQRTLVGVVKALLHRPALLVLDEPTASLDPDVAQRVRAGIETACNEYGTAVLITSHDMREVERVCERVVFMARGKVVADDAPAAVAASYGHETLEGVFLELSADEDA
jgi:ABC-2 type transport system ATP-binding protein